MRFSLISAVLTASSLVNASINLGKLNGQASIAWVGGSDPCKYTVIAPANTNPCEIKFTPSNGFTYSLKGCGGREFALYNNDGSFNAYCNPTSYSKTCGGQKVHQEWGC